MIFRMSDFSEDEKTLAIEYIAEAMRSIVEMNSYQHAKYMIDGLGDTEIDGESKIEIIYSINTIGNDILTAIGAARRKIKRDRS